MNFITMFAKSGVKRLSRGSLIGAKAPAGFRACPFPLLLCILILPFFAFYRFPLDSPFYDELLEIFCFALGLLGLGIRLSTAGYGNVLGGDGVLNTKGTYSLTRNPLDLGNFVFWLAPVLFFHSVVLLAAYCLFFFLYFRRSIVERETAHRRRFGKEYDAWAARTPVLFPKSFRWERPGVPFSWKTAIQSEYRFFFGLVAIIAALEFIGDWIIHRTPTIDAAWASVFLLSGGAYVFVYSMLGVSSVAALLLIVFFTFTQRSSGFVREETLGGTPDYPVVELAGLGETNFRSPFWRDPRPDLFTWTNTPTDASLDEQPLQENSSSGILFRGCEPAIRTTTWRPFHSSRGYSYANRYRRCYNEAEGGIPTTVWEKTSVPFRAEASLYKKSFISFHQWDTAMNFSVALAGAAVLANTPADQNVRDWYQDHVRGRDSDRFSSFCKVFGEGQIVLPTYLLLGLSYRYIKIDGGYSQPQFDRVGTWVSRTGRACFAGFPTLLIGQSLLGAARPEAGDSKWKPFSSSHGISGHAFLGAIPFITAAQMTDDVWLKGTLYLGSTLTGWSRINDDCHYLSQVILGWYLAYLSCRSVYRVENPNLGRGLTFFPVVDPEMTGVGVLYRW